MVNWKLGLGSPLNLGPQQVEGGVNLAWFASPCDEMILVLGNDQGESLTEHRLDSDVHRSGEVWHVLVENPPKSFAYGFKVVRDGTASPLLHDPYARELSSSWNWADDEPYRPLGLVSFSPPFDWQDVGRPQHKLEDLVIYETHVRAFTMHPSSGVEHPGTFLGMVEKIPYLKEMGVNAVELLPVHEFNEGEYKGTDPVTKQRLLNVWGYSTVNFFSPMKRYATANSPLSPTDQFRTLVRECHRHNIEVILDVVYNHTAEKDGDSTYSFMGLAPDVYYQWAEQGNQLDFSGCGNTFNANHPVARQLIRDSLRYWHLEIGVDGFRFDLASALSRDERGHPMARPPLLDAISEDPFLSDAWLIAEPWDAGGLYQVGSFPARSSRWVEWNGKFRDTVRSFIKGDQHQIGRFAQRLMGSEDLYGKGGIPHRSLNFITAHDGFSLYDLVSYNHKHNERNGEENQDGTDQNLSWNCGEEGPSPSPDVATLRARQVRNLLLALFLSRGVPMVLMGDEYLHTRQGNNNPWCQDNELNAYLWNNARDDGGFHRFFRKLLAFRRRCSLLREARFLTASDVDWHGVEPYKPDWAHYSHFLAFTLKDPKNRCPLYIAFNAYHDGLTATVPAPPKEREWRLVVHTDNPSPCDIYDVDEAPSVHYLSFPVTPYSALVLQALPVR